MGYIIIGLILGTFGSFFFRTLVVMPVVFFVTLVLAFAGGSYSTMGFGETILFAAIVAGFVSYKLF